LQALVAKISDPEVLAVLVLAFVLGFMVRGAGRGSAAMTPEEVQARLAGMSAAQWADLDTEIEAGRTIGAIRLLRKASGIGLKDARLAVEKRVRQRVVN
jgi:ribosomal protein L7/L12